MDIKKAIENDIIERKVEDIENSIFIRKHIKILKKARTERNNIIHAAHIEADLNPLSMCPEALAAINPYIKYKEF